MQNTSDDDALFQNRELKEQFVTVTVAQALTKLQIASVTVDQYNSYVISKLQPQLCRMITETILKNQEFLEGNTNLISTICTNIVNVVNLAINSAILDSDKIIEMIGEHMTYFENLDNNFFEVTGYHGEFEFDNVVEDSTINSNVERYFGYLDQDLNPEVSKVLSMLKEAVITQLESNPYLLHARLSNAKDFLDQLIRFLRMISLLNNGDILAINLLERINVEALVRIEVEA